MMILVAAACDVQREMQREKVPFGPYQSEEPGGVITQKRLRARQS
jgi:hypothetical protein